MIPKRLVLDTNVCLDLFVFRDPRWTALEQALDSGLVEAVTRSDCRTEWLMVLDYARFGLLPEARAACMARFDAVITCLPDDAPASDATTGPGPAPLPRCSDPDDQKFLEVARDAGAEILITKDKALLKLAGKCRRAGFFSVMKPEAWSLACHA